MGSLFGPPCHNSAVTGSLSPVVPGGSTPVPVSAWAGGPGGEAPLGQAKATLLGAQASAGCPPQGGGQTVGCPYWALGAPPLAGALVSQ